MSHEDPNPYESTDAPPPPPTGETPTQEERNWAMAAHIGPLVVGLLTGGGLGWVVPLVLFLVKTDSPFIVDQARESLNFQITVFIAMLICGLLVCAMGLGFLLMIPVAIAAIVLTIIAGIKASEGVRYRYPWALRLIN